MSEKKNELADLKWMRRAQVKKSYLTNWVNQDWFPNFIKDSFCRIDFGTASKIGIIVDVVEKETTYQFFDGESVWTEFGGYGQYGQLCL